MNCNRVVVARHVDGETDDLLSRTIEQYLRGCMSCTETHVGPIAPRKRIVAEVSRGSQRCVLVSSHTASSGERDAAPPFAAHTSPQQQPFRVA